MQKQIYAGRDEKTFDLSHFSSILVVKMVSKMKLICPSHQDISQIILFLFLLTTSLITSIKIDPDGGYKDIVIRVASDGSVPENDCPKILYNIKVSIYYIIINLFINWYYMLSYDVFRNNTHTCFKNKSTIFKKYLDY